MASAGRASECAEQDGSDERERGQDGQHVQVQSKAHIALPWSRHGKNIAEQGSAAKQEVCCTAESPAEPLRYCTGFRPRY